MSHSVRSAVHTITQDHIQQKAHQAFFMALFLACCCFYSNAKANAFPSFEGSDLHGFDNFTNDIYDYGTLDIEQSGFHYGLRNTISRQQFEIFRAGRDWIDQPNDFYVSREVIISAQALFSYLKPLISSGQLPMDSNHEYWGAAQKTSLGYSIDLMPTGMLMSMNWHF